MKLSASIYADEKDFDDWEAFVNAAHSGSFLHKRHFLSYHGSRFQDRSIVFRDGAGTIRAVLPAATDPSDKGVVSSHPGATYGGLLVCDRASAEVISQAFSCARSFYKELGFSALVYKTVPAHFHRRLMESDAYFLWREKAELIRRDLWNVVKLNVWRKLSKGRKWGIAKGKKADVAISLATVDADIESFHGLLSTCLTENHQTSPVHSADELKLLMERFPDDIKLWLAHNNDGTILAGALVFNANSSSPHTQYIATGNEGRDLFAGDFLLAEVIDQAEAGGADYFSFGASTENAGQRLNLGLFDYKSGFGVGSVVHDTYRMTL